MNNLLSTSFVFTLVLLFWTLVLLVICFLPGYRGGGFIRNILFISFVLNLYLLVNDSLINNHIQEVKNKLSWNVLFKVWIIFLSLLFSVLLFGIILGSFLFLSCTWIYSCQVKPHIAFTLAVVIGIVLPFLFSNLLALNLWEGLIPTLIPGWLGGGILPPV